MKYFILWLMMIVVISSCAVAEEIDMNPCWDVYCRDANGNIKAEWQAIFEYDLQWHSISSDLIRILWIDDYATNMTALVEKVLEKEPENALGWYYLATRLPDPSTDTINTAINHAIAQKDDLLYGGIACYTSFRDSRFYEHMLDRGEQNEDRLSWWRMTIFSFAESGCAFLGEELKQMGLTYSEADFLLEDIYNSYLSALCNCIRYHHGDTDLQSEDYIEIMEQEIAKPDIPLYFSMLLLEEKLNIAYYSSDEKMLLSLYEEYNELKKEDLKQAQKEAPALEDAMYDIDLIFEQVGLE